MKGYVALISKRDGVIEDDSRDSLDSRPNMLAMSTFFD